MRARSLAAMALALLPLPLAACGGNGAKASALGDGRMTQVRVTVTDYAIVPDPATTVAGRVTFRAQNAGTDEHEMEVFRTDLEAGDIPVVEDRIAPQVPGLERIGEIEELDAGYAGVLTLDLPAGRYMLICDEPGHFRDGMWAEFQVR